MREDPGLDLHVLSIVVWWTLQRLLTRVTASDMRGCAFLIFNLARSGPEMGLRMIVMRLNRLAALICLLR